MKKKRTHKKRTIGRKQKPAGRRKVRKSTPKLTPSRAPAKKSPAGHLEKNKEVVEEKPPPRRPRAVPTARHRWTKRPTAARTSGGAGGPSGQPPLEQPAMSFLRKLKRDRRAREKDKAAQSEFTRDQTPMRIYLDQIEKIPLLSAKQELEVARRVTSKTKDAEVARELMIRSNLRLVISIAKRYSNLGLNFSDLVEEGNIGLMRAVDKFDPARGYRFSTYASWWIKQAIMRALSNQGKTIRIPVYMFDIISRYRRIRDELVQRLGRIPTRLEIAKLLKVPEEKVAELEGVVSRPSSLNAAVSMEGQAELIDLIEDDSFETPLQETEDLLRGQRIQTLLKILDDREKRILELRYGLGTEEPHTLEQTAQFFNITRERVRQIEAVALKKIRYQMAIEADKPEDYLS